MLVRRVPFLVFVWLVAAPAWGVTPLLVKDINTVPTPQGSFPQSFAASGGLAYFAANDGASGSELWRSDGTPAGTFQLADTCAGECGGNPVVVAQGDGKVFFRAFVRDGFGPIDLWVTDGSIAGTIRLGGPFLLFDLPRQSLWQAPQGVLYFAANDLHSGTELWRSDGTPAGTFAVTDLRPGAAGADPAELTELAGRLYFRADDGVRGPALWSSDGTAAGTRLVFDPLPGSAAHAGPDLLRVLGGKLTFTAPLGRKKVALFRSDGTTGGTSTILTLPSTPDGASFLDATVLGSRLLFVASQPSTGRELWASDGTPRGTRALTRFRSESPFLPLNGNSARLLPERAVNGRMVVRADDGEHGFEPWVTDGTLSGTRLLRDLCPGSCPGSGTLEDDAFAGRSGVDLLYFSGDDGARGAELWATDGTIAGTRLVRDLCRGECGSRPSTFRAAATAVYFLAFNGAGNPQLWRSDGSSAGTVRLTSFASQSALSGLGARLGSALLFSANDAEHGYELWRSDGSAVSTRLLVDLNREDLGGSYPAGFRSAAGRAWFFAQDGEHGYELWSSDGAEAGTALIHEFVPGSEPARAPEVGSALELGGKLLFLVHLQEPSLSLWSSNGAPGGTVRLSPPELRILASEPLRAVGGRSYFVAADDGGEELWSSDGTAAGTRRVVDLVPGAEGSEPRSLTVFHDRVFFTARLAGLGRELWTSDGTEAGTKLVRDIDPRPGLGSDPALLTVHGDRLYFPAADPEHGRELWTSDGTLAGTRLAAEVTPGPDGLFMTHLFSSGSHLFFSGGPADPSLQGLWVSDGTTGGTRQIGAKLIHIDDREIGAPRTFGGALYFASTGDEILWRSDGTEEGTGPLHNADGFEIDEPEALTPFAGRLFFTTGQDGVLYETDGTEAGTLPVLKLAPPPAAGVPATSYELVVGGGRLLFQAWNRSTGSEVWGLMEE